MKKDTKKVGIADERRPGVAAAAKNLATHRYGPQGPYRGSSFASREELAVLVSRQLGAELLQQARQRQANQPPPTPLRSGPAWSGPLDALPPEPRSVRTNTGIADWQEPARSCPRCRRAFSPKEQEPGHRPD